MATPLPNLALTFPITKAAQLDDGSLLVEGYATSEAVDSADEVIDYPTTKALFAEWPGNIREQHDMRKAVGRALDWSADDAGKRIFLRARVSAGAPETIIKVLDGTLNCFSIMGPLKERRTETVTRAGGSPQLVRRLVLKRIAEVSLVDSGANPDSRFVVVKADDPPAPQERGVAKGDTMKVATINEQFVAKAAAMGLELTPPTDVAKVGFDPQGWSWQGSDQTRDALEALYALAILESLVRREELQSDGGTEGVSEAEQGAQVTLLAEAVGKIQDFIGRELKEKGETAAKASEGGAEVEPSAEEAAKADEGDAGEEAPAGEETAKADDDPPAEPPGEAPEAEPTAHPEAAAKAASVVQDEGTPSPTPENVMKVESPADELVAKLDGALSEITTLKADVATMREEASELRKENEVLKAQVAEVGERVVEPGRPVFLGPDGKPTGNTADGGGLPISVDEIADIVAKSNGDPNAVKRAVALRVAELQIRKTVAGR